MVDNAAIDADSVDAIQDDIKYYLESVRPRDADGGVIAHFCVPLQAHEPGYEPAMDEFYQDFDLSGAGEEDDDYGAPLSYSSRRSL
jgi:hypothetical protein